MPGRLILLALPLIVLAPPLAARAQAPSADMAVDSPASPDNPPYNAVGHRDPFRPFTLDIRPESRVPMTPLERYELGQLTVVATMWNMNPARAVLEDSSGMGFIVTVGTPIGPNGGVVTAIESKRVIVEERLSDYYGKEQIHRTVMETPKDEGPGQALRERK